MLTKITVATITGQHWVKHINILRPIQNCRHFADAIFKFIFLKENVWISLKISLKFVPKGRINNIPALVQIMGYASKSHLLLANNVLLLSYFSLIVCLSTVIMCSDVWWWCDTLWLYGCIWMLAYEQQNCLKVLNNLKRKVEIFCQVWA